MGLSLVVFIILPFLTTFFNYVSFKFINSIQNIRNAKLYFDTTFIIILYANIFIILGFIGGRPVEEPYLTLGFAFTCFYFFTIIFIPLINIFTQFIIYNKKINN